MIIFITGGVKNGKSTLAQELTVRLCRGRTHYYLATMIPVDDEDRERIRRHIADRDGMDFETVECGRNLLSCLEQVDPNGGFLLDSATALLMNEMFLPPDWHMDESAGHRCGEEIVKFAKSVADIVIVSDYIYSDAERYDSVTESYRRCLAEIDRRLAAVSDTVIELSAGNVIVHKGELPV